MFKFIKKIQIVILSAVLLASITLSPISMAKVDNSKPAAINMLADAFIARPLMLVSTALGTVFYLVTLPFSLLGGNAKDAGTELVLKPAKATFLRCLGCKINRVGADNRFTPAKPE
jgi:hypothetical protein